MCKKYGDRFASITCTYRESSELEFFQIHYIHLRFISDQFCLWELCHQSTVDKHNTHECHERIYNNLKCYFGILQNRV